MAECTHVRYGRGGWRQLRRQQLAEGCGRVMQRKRAGEPCHCLSGDRSSAQNNITQFAARGECRRDRGGSGHVTCRVNFSFSLARLASVSRSLTITCPERLWARR